MKTLIDRREALRRTAMIMGAAVSASTVVAFLEGCKNVPDLNYKPIFFNEDQARLISAIAEIIIPKTDTPGAIDAGVPNFIDMLVNECYKPEDQKLFVEEIKKLDEGAREKYGEYFIDCDGANQKEYILNTHEDAVRALKKDGTIERPFILKLKELTMLGYFVSEPGATQVLQYNQVPGVYRGCVPLNEAGNGKTWA